MPQRFMQHKRDKPFFAVFLSLVLHGVVLAVGAYTHVSSKAKAKPAQETVVYMAALVPPAVAQGPATPPAVTMPAAPAPATARDISVQVKEERKHKPPAAKPQAAAQPADPPSDPPEKQPASQTAPDAPSQQEWAFAARYTLKNSKAYRHTWGKQVRSLMGTAVEGPDQGVVRFRVEIAPDGSLARLDTLWSTSPVAEERARAAMQNMPPLPPTPTGKPLVFEKTISFSPFHTDLPPVYKGDCLPEPPRFRNPFAWDGKGAPASAHGAPPDTTTPDTATPGEATDPMALEDCQKQLPQDSIEAEAAHDQRQLDQWGSSKLDQ